MELGALPGTMRTASVVIEIPQMQPNQRWSITFSTEGLTFNETEQRAWFSTLHVLSECPEGILVTHLSNGDVIEDVARWTVQRVVSLVVENRSQEVKEDVSISVLLLGYPPAPTPRVEDFDRKDATVVNNVGEVMATAKNGVPLDCDSEAMITAGSPRVEVGTVDVNNIGNAKEIVIEHDPLFNAGLPVISGVSPVNGFRIIPLVYGSSGLSTDDTRFVLLIERPGGYSGESLHFDWIRKES